MHAPRPVPLILLALGLFAADPGHAVVILDDTWAAEGGGPGHESTGFGAHIALANQPQFDALITFSSDGGTEWGVGSGTWIGNDQDHGYVLTAAHNFDGGTKASDYLYRSKTGRLYHGDRVTIHPLYRAHGGDRTGYDAAVVRLDRPVTDAGPPPVLYGGHREKGQRVTIVGFGSRGIGSRGEKPAFYTGSDKAAAENVIDDVLDTVEPVPAKADAGNWLEITFRRAGKPGVTRYEGILGSGDSGGSLWMQVQGRWVIAGINVNGDGDTYGSKSWFARVSGLKGFILGAFAGAGFTAD